MSQSFSYLDLNRTVSFISLNRDVRKIWTKSITTLSRIKNKLSSNSIAIKLRVMDGFVAEQTIANYLQDRGYFTGQIGSGHGIFGIMDHVSGDYPVASVVCDTSRSLLVIIAYGDVEETTSFIKWAEETFPNTGVMIYTADSIDNQRLIKTATWVDSREMQIANDVFYPWMTISLAEYFKAYMESDEAVLVLVGPPGTGKSTFIRSLINSGNYTSLIAYSAEVVSSPVTVKEFYKDKELRILAYEDVDVYIEKRENGNRLMSSFLNVSDGVLQNPGKKIIFSTNLESINGIDPALLRTGRCFDILEFRALTREEAQDVLKSIGREPGDFSSKERWNLEQVFKTDNPAIQRRNRFGQRTGFVGK